MSESIQGNVSFYNKLDDKEKERIIRAGYDAVHPLLPLVPLLGDDNYEQVRDDCLNYFRTGKIPQPKSPPLNAECLKKASPQPLVLVARDLEDPCTQKQIAVAIDTFSILIGLCGIGYGIAKPAATELVNGIPKIGLEKLVEAFKTAKSTWDYCLAIAKVGGTMWNYFSMSALLKALKDNMHWYDWIIASVTLVGTILAMCATDGLALAGEIALNAAGIAQLTEDVIAMRSACGI